MSLFMNSIYAKCAKCGIDVSPNTVFDHDCKPAPCAKTIEEEAHEYAYGDQPPPQGQDPAWEMKRSYIAGATRERAKLLGPSEDEELPLDERCYQAGHRYGVADERARLRELLGEIVPVLRGGRHPDINELLARIAAEIGKP
jgi:hypothetical protein